MYAAARQPIRSAMSRLSIVGSSQRLAPLPRATTLSLRRNMADMPVPQSSKAVLFDGHARSEGWESTMAVWYGTSLLLLIATLGLTPNTEIETWAKQEATARLAMADNSAAFGTHHIAKNPTQVAQKWEKFASKATKWDDDDDDDEDDE
ncbi:hypothetical protein MPSEU_000057100 [Mayamaea pseudoterrestris]|nr:hypothetical protein MPSEU_000057100 [Mayamaea pseudoterrestris]